jgi:hypothetical protein
MGGRLMPYVLSVLGALLLSILANDMWALSAPCARRLVVVAARLWARDPEQQQTLSEEWRAYIDDRPGQLLKLCTACAFLVVAVGRQVGHKFQARRRPAKPPLAAAPAWTARSSRSFDAVAAQANAVAVGLLVGFVSVLAPMVGYVIGNSLQWAVIVWGVGLTVAVGAVLASVVFGLFVRRQDALPRDVADLDRLARILAMPPGTPDAPAATEASRLVRPFVVQSHHPATRDNTPTGLVRPYIGRTDTDTTRRTGSS